MAVHGVRLGATRCRIQATTSVAVGLQRRQHRESRDSHSFQLGPSCPIVLVASFLSGGLGSLSRYAAVITAGKGPGPLARRPSADRVQERPKPTSRGSVTALAEPAQSPVWCVTVRCAAPRIGVARGRLIAGVEERSEFSRLLGRTGSDQATSSRSERVRVRPTWWRGRNPAWGRVEIVPVIRAERRTRDIVFDERTVDHQLACSPD